MVFLSKHGVHDFQQKRVLTADNKHHTVKKPLPAVK